MDDGSDFSVIEEFLEGRLKHMSFEDAIADTNDKLGAFFPGASDYLEQRLKDRKASAAEFVKLNELGVAQAKDIQEMGWYTGVDTAEGIWAGLRNRMESGGLSSAVPSIDASSDMVVASLAEPKVDNAKRRGIVIGNVQSGKTANYSAVIAKALDCGYRLIIVMSGIHNNLRQQTQARLDRDLGIVADYAEWVSLTGEEGDFGKAYIKNATSMMRDSKRAVAVVKKHGTRLRNLLAFLQNITEDVRKNLPILIVDDESDQATPDSAPGLDDDPTVINQLMREIWAEVRNGTYVGYTATPFANIFMNPDLSSETSLEGLYPRDFIHVMPTPAEYFGAERIFGIDEDADYYSNRPDVIRQISQTEVEMVAPKGNREESAAQIVPKSLGDAIKWFIVAAAVRRMRGQGEKHSTMLVHTTYKTDPHFAMRDAIVDFLEPLKRKAREDDVENFREIFHEEMDRAAELYKGSGPAPTWGRIISEIPTVLRSLKVAVDNSKAKPEERLHYEDDSPQTVIVVGGGTLARGLTLEGLFVSYFCRSSNTYDTLLQMGRWFGYRKGYEDLQRIWLSPGLALDYQFLATVESDLRSDVARMIKLKQTPEMIGVRVRQHPGRLQIVTAAKMKHAQQVSVDFEGARLQTTVFDVREPEHLLSNAKLVESLLGNLEQWAVPDIGNVFLDVPLPSLAEFFAKFSVHERFKDTFDDLYKWSAEKLPEQLWSVVVASGRGDGSIAVGQRESRAVQRAPLTPGSPGSEPGEINIRALMSSEDIVLDLKHSGVVKSLKSSLDKDILSHEEQYDLRRSKDGADGHGLLVLYPISRFSKPPTKSESTRVPMDEALAGIDPVLVDPSLPPIIGVAAIAPYDVKHVLRYDEKGTFVAVKPVYEDDVYEEDEYVGSDDEPDFDGGQS